MYCLEGPLDKCERHSFFVYSHICFVDGCFFQSVFSCNCIDLFLRLILIHAHDLDFTKECRRKLKTSLNVIIVVITVAAII